MMSEPRLTLLVMADGLSDDERRMLALERERPRNSGPKESAIREMFAVSSTRYHQRLNKLIDNPAALAHDPVTVNRLRRLRDKRRRERIIARRAG